jgi:GNAT superfamily N-acetyltransferase
MNGCIQISTEKEKLDIGLIYDFLSASYWGKEYTLDTVRNSVKNSLCFGIYKDGKQIGFARVLTDYTRLAYLADVFVIENYRNQGLGKMLLEHIFSFPELVGVKRWLLATADAVGLYQKFGFRTLSNPERYMEKRN